MVGSNTKEAIATLNKLATRSPDFPWKVMVAHAYAKRSIATERIPALIEKGLREFEQREKRNSVSDLFPREDGEEGDSLKFVYFIPAADYARDQNIYSIPRNWVVGADGVLQFEGIGFGSDGNEWMKRATEMIEKVKDKK